MTFRTAKKRAQKLKHGELLIDQLAETALQPCEGGRSSAHHFFITNHQVFGASDTVSNSPGLEGEWFGVFVNQGITSGLL
jgi:hypothetical protein